jgi:F-box domain
MGVGYGRDSPVLTINIIILPWMCVLSSECKKTRPLPPTMGASHNIIDSQDHGFQSFPVELVIDILLRLSLHDLTTCRRVNRTLNSIINGSQAVQHLIDTIVAGVVDNPKPDLSLFERRAALARRQKAWDSGTPQCITECITTTKPFHPPIVKQNGLYYPNHVAYCSPPHPNQAWDESWPFAEEGFLQSYRACRLPRRK